MFGNGIVAIVAGVIAQAATDQIPLTEVAASLKIHIGGYCSPFDLAIICLVVQIVLMGSTWGENYGEGSGGELSLAAFKDATDLIFSDVKLFSLGLVCALFEGSMYSFIFMWTPAMTPDHENKPPYGLIFATFMLGCMGGSKIFGIAVKSMSCSTITLYVFTISAVCMSVPAFTESQPIILVAFIIFEVCVGMYWPAMGTIKSALVPENARATVYSLFRVPLNAIVLTVLLVKVDQGTVFLSCSVMLGLASVIQFTLKRDPKAEV
jgi:hypothetical protein